jgi:hypothetical protein
VPELPTTTPSPEVAAIVVKREFPLPSSPFMMKSAFAHRARRMAFQHLPISQF